MNLRYIAVLCFTLGLGSCSTLINRAFHTEHPTHGGPLSPAALAEVSDVPSSSKPANASTQSETKAGANSVRTVHLRAVNALASFIVDADRTDPGVVARLAPALAVAIRDELGLLDRTFPPETAGRVELRDADLRDSLRLLQKTLAPDQRSAFWAYDEVEGTRPTPGGVVVARHLRSESAVMLADQLGLGTAPASLQDAPYQEPTDDRMSRRESDHAVSARLSALLGVSNCAELREANAAPDEGRQVVASVEAPNVKLLPRSELTLPKDANSLPRGPNSNERKASVSLADVATVTSIARTAYDILKPAAAATPGCSVTNIVNVGTVTAEMPEVIPAAGEVAVDAIGEIGGEAIIETAGTEFWEILLDSCFALLLL